MNKWQRVKFIRFLKVEDKICEIKKLGVKSHPKRKSLENKDVYRTYRKK